MCAVWAAYIKYQRFLGNLNRQSHFSEIRRKLPLRLLHGGNIRTVIKLIIEEDDRIVIGIFQICEIFIVLTV